VGYRPPIVVGDSPPYGFYAEFPSFLRRYLYSKLDVQRFFHSERIDDNPNHCRSHLNILEIRKFRGHGKGDQDGQNSIENESGNPAGEKQ
jgi:hypothetical protein